MLYIIVRWFTQCRAVNRTILCSRLNSTVHRNLQCYTVLHDCTIYHLCRTQSSNVPSTIQYRTMLHTVSRSIRDNIVWWTIHNIVRWAIMYRNYTIWYDCAILYRAVHHVLGFSIGNRTSYFMVRLRYTTSTSASYAWLLCIISYIISCYVPTLYWIF
jgi:hypothetical protein